MDIFSSELMSSLYKFSEPNSVWKWGHHAVFPGQVWMDDKDVDKISIFVTNESAIFFKMKKIL